MTIKSREAESRNLVFTFQLAIVQVLTFAVGGGNLLLLAGPDIKVLVAVRVLVPGEVIAETVHRVRSDIWIWIWSGYCTSLSHGLSCSVFRLVFAQIKC